MPSIAPETSAQPRARGAVRLGVKPGPGGATALQELHQAGSLKALFPRRAGGALQAVMVNTAGGVTGGDRFTIRARAGEGAELTLTTQAAERAYRAQPGEEGRIETRLAVERGARVNWLPQETILYDGSALRRSLVAELAGDARLLLVEPLIFGRAAMGERLGKAAFHDRIEIRRGGGPLFLDAVALEGNVSARLARAHVAGGAGAMASLVFVAPEAEAHLAALRAMLPETAGASLVREGVLFARALAADSFELRRFLIPILNRLTENQLPRTWMI